MTLDSTFAVLMDVQYEAAPHIEDNNMIEKQRLRALRRHSERKVQRRRLRTHWWVKKYGNPRLLGRLRHNHFGCGCGICKPWKYHDRKKLTFKERKEQMEEY